mmetsp:Transcript_3635/g.6481  ORF Transcript_3635/g.6481 Transcript_3635/m.6481 type:complete len:517 (+) Transcript_3635:90-1640(+)
MDERSHFLNSNLLLLVSPQERPHFCQHRHAHETKNAEQAQVVPHCRLHVILKALTVHQLLLHDPPRDGLILPSALVLLGDAPVLRLLSGLDMVHLRRLVKSVARLGIQVRVGALSRVRLMHPLREETSMERNHATVVAGDFVEMLQQVRWQRPVGAQGGGRQSLDQVDDLLRSAHGSFEPLFYLVHQLLALIEAADAVVTGWLDAVRWPRKVVGDDDLGILWVRLVEDAVLTKVFRAFGEVEVKLVIAVEVSQADKTAAVAIFQGGELALHDLAFLVLEGSQAFAELREDHAQRLEFEGCGPASYLVDDGVEQIPGFLMAREPELEVLQRLMNLSFREAFHLRSGDESRQVSPQQIACLIEIDGILGFHGGRLVDNAKALVDIGLEHLVHRGSQNRQLMKGHAIRPQAILEELTHLWRHAVAHGRHWGLSVPGASSRLQALDLPAVALVEQPVQRVSRRGSGDCPSAVLRQRLEGDSQVSLELVQALLSCLAVLSTQDLLQLLQKRLGLLRKPSQG